MEEGRSRLSSPFLKVVELGLGTSQKAAHCKRYTPPGDCADPQQFEQRSRCAQHQPQGDRMARLQPLFTRGGPCLRRRWMAIRQPSLVESMRMGSPTNPFGRRVNSERGGYCCRSDDGQRCSRPRLNVSITTCVVSVVPMASFLVCAHPEVMHAIFGEVADATSGEAAGQGQVCALPMGEVARDASIRSNPQAELFPGRSSRRLRRPWPRTRCSCFASAAPW